MAENERDIERVDADQPEIGTADADPTLDIVRKLIVDAEALPAPARRPAGPATPRPGASGAVPGGAVPGRAVAPAPGLNPTDPQEPAADAAPDAAPGAWAGARPDAVPDAVPEAWDDDVDEDSWDEIATGDLTRHYRIVDPESGALAAPDGDWDGEWDEDDFAADPAELRPRRSGLLRRLLGTALSALGALVVRAARALAAWVAAGLAAVGRRIAKFLRRPDAPRRLAISLLVIFVIAWPFKVLWLTLLIPLAALITWASVGNEGCVELTLAWHNRLKARDGEKAERIRLRAAATSRAISRVLDRLPERWTQGLYLPDFEPEGYVPEKLQVDPFEELAARVHSAKRAGGH